MKNLFLVISFLALTSNLIGQTVAISGWNSDTPDGFTLVALVDIPPTINIFLTDRAYSNTTNTFPDIGSVNENNVQVTWTGTWQKGTLIRMVESSPDVFTITISDNGPSGVGIILTDGSFGLTGSDGLSIYTSANTSDPGANIDEIFGYIEGDGTSDPNPVLDVDCPCSTDFISLEFNNSNVDGGNFTPGLRDSEVTLANFNNTSNWTTSSSNIPGDLTEFSDLDFGSLPVSFLPVEFTSFTAETDRAGVLLKWQTAKEENNGYFQIEHSIDGRNFSSLGKIDGNGTTNNFSNYTFLDEKPAAGINYYRLKQVDYDGAFEYSDIASAQFGDGSATVVVYPNPFSDQLTLSLPTGSGINDQVSNPILKITNLHGQVIKQEAIVSAPNHSLNLGDLAAGTYILQVYQDGLVSTTQRLVKL